ncbi:uncharacterized protein LOC106084946 [Stomoxys calcitrans]|uniref:uncharacterized protein LOC106084946 n=1 Tax=Stomoxys calcitrans TaxID=35570 RepID=UPI0027E26665|nr:uncharacterized protein LOC106084946 [Stomoxys calcitrans]
MNRKSLFIFLLLKAYLFASGDGSYIVVAPDTIQSNNEYSVSISLPGNTEPTTVKVEISGGSFTAAKTIDIPEYNTAVAKFNVPILENGVYTLKVQGIEGYEFVNTTQLKYVERENISDYLRNDGEMRTILNQNTTAKRFGPLNLKFKREKYRIFRDVVIKVNSTNPIPYLIYDVMVKGNIIKHEYLEVSGENTMEYITITPTSDMIPKANIYVYYLENGTLLWDDLSLFFATKSKCLKNDTEYDRLVANGEVEELDFRKPPGEESHLVTLTNMHYVLEGANSTFSSWQSTQTSANHMNLLMKFGVGDRYFKSFNHLQGQAHFWLNGFVNKQTMYYWSGDPQK